MIARLKVKIFLHVVLVDILRHFLELNAQVVHLFDRFRLEAVLGTKLFDFGVYLCVVPILLDCDEVKVVHKEVGEEYTVRCLVLPCGPLFSLFFGSGVRCFLL